MFRTVVIALLLLLPAALRAQRFSYQRDYERILLRTRDARDSLSYAALLPRFLRNDPGLTVFQMLSLMIGYTGRDTYRPYEDLATEKLIYNLNNEAKYKEALRICDTFLERHPLNQTAIIEKAYAFHKLDRQDSSAFYKEQFGRIMAAMDWSADGRSPDRAMFAIGPQDGRNFIDKYYHADLGRSGSAEDSQGNFCAMLEMKFRKDGKDQSLVFYFAIQHAVNTTAAPRPGHKAP